ncbi:MAG: hypothetical protein PHQ93_00050 [Sulfurimonas sp.]|uniref:hypothetical protein n=1 Tax=Sulfurimonas sp. TaxID=2022749 RepID=UPI002609EDFD|nr:hypothetical protein [Sulfurimonas sp.]MDD5399566.1 hypothetical protein [Sulfurimonas sp.]
MKNVNLFIKDNIKAVNDDILILLEISDKKLTNAIKAFDCDENLHKYVIALYDTTKLGTGKEGLLFTGEKILYNNGKEIVVFNYKNIKSVEYLSEIKKGILGKQNIYEYIKINMNSEDYIIDNLCGMLPSKNFNYNLLAEFIDKIISEFDTYKEEENKLKSFDKMPEEFKIAYLKIIVNMTFDDDNKIDEKELAELLLLITRLELTQDSRFEIRLYIANISNENIIPNEDLLNKVINTSNLLHYKSIMISLLKDMINIYFSTKKDESIEHIIKDIDSAVKNNKEIDIEQAKKVMSSINFNFLETNRKLFNVSDEDIFLAYLAIANDYKIIHKDLDDNSIKKIFTEFGATASSIGVPLGAVYLSGSVVGLSASGISSGLAFLGMRGLGFLNPMTAGIATAILIGTVTYKGIKHLSGVDKLDKYKTREFMLHEVIKLTQKTISMLIDDINYVIRALNDTTVEQKKQNSKINELTLLMASTLKCIDNKQKQSQNSMSRIKVPKILDESRLKILTTDVAKEHLYRLVIENYNKETLLLNEYVDTDTLDEISRILENLGYFETDNVLRGAALNGLNNIKGLPNG